MIDGALFAYVLGADPETLLLLEARGRRDELAGYYKQREVWRVDRRMEVERDEPYFLRSLPDPARRK